MTDRDNDRRTKRQARITPLFVIFSIVISVWFFTLGYSGLGKTGFASGEFNLSPVMQGGGDLTHWAMMQKARSDNGYIYPALASLSSVIFGDGEFGARLPALFFGAVAVLFLTLFAALFVPRKVAFIFGTLLLISPSLMFISLTAKGFTLFLASFAILLFSAALMGYGTTDNKSRILYLTISLLFLIIEDTSRLGIWVCAVTAYIMFVRRNSLLRENGIAAADVLFKRILAVAGIYAVTQIIYLLIPDGSMARVAEAFSSYSKMYKEKMGVPGYLAMCYIGAIGGFDDNKMAVAGYSIPVIAIGMLKARKIDPAMLRKVLLTGLISLVACLFSFVSFHREPLGFLYHRLGYCAALMLPFAYMLTACCLYAVFGDVARVNPMNMKSAKELAKITFTIVFTVFFMFMTAIFMMIGRNSVMSSEREGWKESIKALKQEIRGGDVIVYREHIPNFFRYYCERYDLAAKRMMPVGDDGDTVANWPDARRVWFVSYFPPGIVKNVQGEDLIYRIHQSVPNSIISGYLGNVQIALVDGYIVNDKMKYIFEKNRKTDDASGKSCDVRNQDCGTRLFVHDAGNFDFRIHARLVQDIPTEITVVLCSGERNIRLDESGKATERMVVEKTRTCPLAIRSNSNIEEVEIGMKRVEARSGMIVKQ